MQKHAEGSLINLITQEVEAFKQPISYADGIKFDHYEILKRINLYTNDEFFECTEDDAVFWNLAKSRIPHFAKKIDLDTKNFKLEGLGDANFYQSWVINMRFQRWARESGFALDLDDLSESVSVYGSIVKKVIPVAKDEETETYKYDIEECDLSRLFFDTTAKELYKRTKIEYHEMSEAEMRDYEGTWDNIDEALAKAEKVQGTAESLARYIIWERVGEYKEKDSDEPKFMHHFVCGKGKEEVVLYEEEISYDDDPYYDFHLSGYRGRWLRVGVYERLFSLQEQVNELVNNNREAQKIASLLLLRSTEEDLTGKNVLRQAVSGMILNSADLQQIGIDNRFVNEFLANLMQIERKADELSMTPDFITGDALPANSTFRGQAVLTNVASSAFKSSRDRIGFRVFRLLEKKILPSIIVEWNKEDLFTIAENDNDIMLFDNVAMRLKTNQYILNEWRAGNSPTPKEIQAYQNKLIKDWDMFGRKIAGLKDFFNFKYGFRMNPTGENENREQLNEVYFNALQMIQANPAIVNNPMFRQYVEKNGINPIRMTMEQIAQFNQSQAQAAPQPVAKPDKLLSAVDTSNI